jgi:hypothetical protein
MKNIMKKYLQEGHLKLQLTRGIDIRYYSESTLTSKQRIYNISGQFII